VETNALRETNGSEMNDVPKFVRQRMRQPVPGNHPDANLLAAFHEGGLTKHEREQVLLHLATCAVCRDALALALPEVVELPSATPARARWLRWPMLRWAGVGAAVVVVAAAVVIQNSRRSIEVPRSETTMAPATRTEVPQEPAHSVAGNRSAPVLRDEAQTKTRLTPKKEVAENRATRAKAEQPADKDSANNKLLEKKQDAFVGQAVSSAPAMAQANNRAAQSDELQQLPNPTPNQSYDVTETTKAQQPQNSSDQASNTGMIAPEQKQPQAPVPARPSNVNESVEVVGESAAVKTQKAKSQRADSDKNYADRAQTAEEATSSMHGAGPAVVGGALAPGSTGGPVLKAAGSGAPRWRLATQGNLERSTDAGRSWQPVRLGNPPATLRSFSAVGRDIWTGGAGGALYHSADNGLTWTRIRVTAGDAVLQADIVRVEFTDAQHGAVLTSSGEKWTTDNAGASWTAGK
jgi:photosynthesis system II assembly factor YCF48-like protein/putative zinc finger protein